MSRFRVFLVAALVHVSSSAYAQSDLGSLRGYVKDEQGAFLPGVTVTVTGSGVISPIVVVTDATGYYRLLNIPPGSVVLSAELPGFAPHRREGIVIRAGATFALDIDLKVGELAESITVTGDSPMVEVLKSGTSFTISGELLRAAPVTSRALYTDSVDLIPGIASRQGVDGSGVRVYYYMGADQFANHTALEGATYGGFANPAAPRTSMSTETVADTEMRTGGADASTPLTIGVYQNVIAPQGGNAIQGSAGVTLQPLAWNSDNASGGRVAGGNAKPEGVQMFDFSFGGPIRQEKIWFFSTYRWARDTNGISRTPLNLENLQAYRPDFTPFNNTWRTNNPFIKVTAQLNPKHTLSSFYIYDRAYYTSNLEYRRGCSGISIRRRVVDANEAELVVELASHVAVLVRVEQQGEQLRKDIPGPQAECRTAGAGPQRHLHLWWCPDRHRRAGAGQQPSIDDVDSLLVHRDAR